MQARAKALDNPTEWIYGIPRLVNHTILTPQGPREYIPETLSTLVFSNPTGDIFEHDIVLSPSTGFRLLAAYIPQWGGFDFIDSSGYILCSADLVNIVKAPQKDSPRKCRRKFSLEDALAELRVLDNIIDHPAARSTLSITGYGTPPL